jgi:polar amino acid transport system substrate-binding protein
VCVTIADRRPACFGAIAAKAQESLLDTVLKRDKIIVATYSTSPPLAYADEKGDLVGFEIDMVHEIAKDLLGDPNEGEFMVVQSDGRFPAVLSGKVDLGLCSTMIYPDRARTLSSFS